MRPGHGQGGEHHDEAPLHAHDSVPPDAFTRPISSSMGTSLSAPYLQAQHPGGVLRHETVVVGDHDGGHALRPQRLQDGGQLGLVPVVQPPGRLVQDQYARLSDQYGCQGGPFPLARS